MTSQSIRTFTLISGLGLGFSATSCSRPPTEAVNVARTALEEARDAEASDYALESLGVAEDAMNELESEIAAQGRKLPLLRSYARVEKLAVAARAAAEKATREATAGRETARAEVADIMADVHASLEEVQELLARAPRWREVQAEIDLMMADVAAVESGIEDIETAMGAEHYRDARTRARIAQTTLDRVRAEVRAAIDGARWR